MDDNSAEGAIGKQELTEARTPRQELSEFIAGQEGRIGDVYNLSREGLDARGIADSLNVATQGFV